MRVRVRVRVRVGVGVRVRVRVRVTGLRHLRRQVAAAAPPVEVVLVEEAREAARDERLVELDHLLVRPLAPVVREEDVEARRSLVRVRVWGRVRA